MMSMVSNEANMGGDTALQLESQRMQRVHIYVGPTITRLHTALPRRLIRLAYSAVTLPLTCYLALSETGMRTRCRRTGAATKASSIRYCDADNPDGGAQESMLTLNRTAFNRLLA